VSVEFLSLPIYLPKKTAEFSLADESSHSPKRACLEKLCALSVRSVKRKSVIIFKK